MTSAFSNDPATNRLFLRSGPESNDGTCDSTARMMQGAAAPRDAWQLPMGFEAILSRLGHCNRFGILAVRMDPPIAGRAIESFQGDLIEQFQQLEQNHTAIWFPWKEQTFGCVIPDFDITSALSSARKVQADLAIRRVETVSIGVTCFPLLDFDLSQSLINACKALDHGAFLGPGSCVTFDSVSLNISGDLYYQAEDFESAIAEYRAALRLDPTNANVRNSLGVCLAQQGELDAARIEFDAVSKSIPGDAMSIFNIGKIHLLEGHHQPALICFQNAYAADNTIFDIPYQIGKVFSEQSQWQEALNYLQAAVALRDDCAPAFFMQGQCLAALGKTREAIAAFKKALKLNPNNAAALSDLGLIYSNKGENLDICLTFCRQSVLLAPQNGLFHYRLAGLYQKDHQLNQALAEYEEAAALGHDAAPQIAEIRRQLEDEEESHKCCAR